MNNSTKRMSVKIITVTFFITGLNLISYLFNKLNSLNEKKELLFDWTNHTLNYASAKHVKKTPPAKL